VKRTFYRYGYAGQVLIGSGLSFARNRVYGLNVGRFLQTDPIGYGAGMNMYGYVGADPINRVAPNGLSQQEVGPVMHPACVWDCGLNGGGGGSGAITVTGDRMEQIRQDIQKILNYVDMMDWLNAGPRSGGGEGETIFVTGTRQHNSPPPKASHQPAPPSSNQCEINATNVALSGTILTGPAGPAHFKGTLTDVATGRTYAVSATGFAGGVAAGTYDVTATVSGFGALSDGLDIKYAQGPFGSGGASFTSNNGRTIGQGSAARRRPWRARPVQERQPGGIQRQRLDRRPRPLPRLSVAI